MKIPAPIRSLGRRAHHARHSHNKIHGSGLSGRARMHERAGAIRNDGSECNRGLHVRNEE